MCVWECVGALHLFQTIMCRVAYTHTHTHIHTLSTPPGPSSIHPSYILSGFHPSSSHIVILAHTTAHENEAFLNVVWVLRCKWRTNTHTRTHQDTPSSHTLTDGVGVWMKKKIYREREEWKKAFPGLIKKKKNECQRHVGGRSDSSKPRLQKHTHVVGVGWHHASYRPTRPLSRLSAPCVYCCRQPG